LLRRSIIKTIGMAIANGAARTRMMTAITIESGPAKLKKT